MEGAEGLSWRGFLLRPLAVMVGRRMVLGRHNRRCRCRLRRTDLGSNPVLQHIKSRHRSHHQPRMPLAQPVRGRTLFEYSPLQKYDRSRDMNTCCTHCLERMLRLVRIGRLREAWACTPWARVHYNRECTRLRHRKNSDGTQERDYIRSHRRSHHRSAYRRSHHRGP